MRRAIIDRGASEQLLHGEPHPGNVLRTSGGLLFIDLETCCRGPIEFDIAHATVNATGPPYEVGARYAGADQSLVRECWILMLAMVTAWRCEPGDDLPNGRAMAMDWIRQLRAPRSMPNRSSRNELLRTCGAGSHVCDRSAARQRSGPGVGGGRLRYDQKREACE